MGRSLVLEGGEPNTLTVVVVVLLLLFSKDGMLCSSLSSPLLRFENLALVPMSNLDVRRLGLL